MIGILVALPLSAALVVVLVAFAGLPVIAGLVLLAVLDTGIVLGGYLAVRRSLASLRRR